MKTLRVKSEPEEPPASIAINATARGYEMHLNVKGINALSNILGLMQDTGNTHAVCQFLNPENPCTLEIFVKLGA